MGAVGHQRHCTNDEQQAQRDHSDSMGVVGADGQAVGRLGADAGEALVDVVSDTHQAVAQRVESLLPGPAVPVAKAHRALADSVYRTVAMGVRRVGTLAGASARREPPPPLLSTVNGLWGDTIERDHPEVAIEMDLLLDLDDLDDLDEPGPATRVAVFVHGLAEHEDAWRLRRRPDDPDSMPYPDRLREDLGLTPVLVRYNTGLPVAENGRRLAGILEQLVCLWPVPVDEVVLIGHSMGGLVARTAAHHGRQADQDWPALLSTVITLGSPHSGAPLAKGAGLLHRALRTIPESEPIGRVLGARSAGLVDLEQGLADEGYAPGVAYGFVAATVTRDVAHPFGRLVGDGLVRIVSAVGGDHAPTQARRTNLGAVGHLGLLNDPSVYAWMRDLLRSSRSTPPPL